VPVNEIDWGEPVALSTRATAATNEPVAFGVKINEIAQPAPAASVGPQVVVSRKLLAFVPVSAMLEIVNAPVPVLVSVTTWALLDVPDVWLKLSEVALN
jgi:hypothetical protein